MKQINKLLVTALMLAALTAGAWAQTQVASNTAPASGSAAPASAPAAAATPTPAPTPAAISAEIEQLKDAISAQKDALAAQQQRIQALEDQLQKAQATATQAAAKPEDAKPANPTQLAEFSTTAGPVNPVEQGTPAGQEQESAQRPEPRLSKEMEGPVTIHFRGINVTPGGFAAAEFVRRSRALGADVITPFNNLTMPGASQSNLSEFFASARQSRPTVFISSRAGNVDFSAYVSGDFLSSGVTATSTQTNGYNLRLRQAWGQAAFAHGWSVLGGQAWSLVTENKVGIGPSDDTGRTNDARPATIDGQYSVGFTYARQNGVRLTKNFNDKVAIAFAVENAQATVTTSGNANDYLLVQPGASNTNNTTSTYGFNPSPDLIAKIAFDPGFGHYEIFGLVDRFQDRIFPCENVGSVTSGSPPVTTVVAVLPKCPSLADANTTAAAYNSSKSGGGFGASARWAFANKHIVFGVKGFGGSGIGRYGASQLSDVSINADGTVHLIKDLQGLATLEWHGKKLDVYSYVGSEYAQRTYSYDPMQSITAGAPTFVGYGAPAFNNSGCYTETAPGTSTFVSGPVPGSLAHCSSQTRDVTEGTIGFWYRFHSGPRGRYQWGVQYSYLNRATWSGTDSGKDVPGYEPHGLDSMVFMSFRYYLP